MYDSTAQCHSKETEQMCCCMVSVEETGEIYMHTCLSHLVRSLQKHSKYCINTVIDEVLQHAYGLLFTQLQVELVTHLKEEGKSVQGRLIAVHACHYQFITTHDYMIVRWYCKLVRLQNITAPSPNPCLCSNTEFQPCELQNRSGRQRSVTNSVACWSSPLHLVTNFHGGSGKLYNTNQAHL